nr:unnamed protein product [Callosobruchus chinensis]
MQRITTNNSSNNFYWVDEFLAKIAPSSKPLPICEAFRDVSYLLRTLYKVSTPQESDYLEIFKKINIVIPNYSENPAVSKNVLNQYLSNYPDSTHIYTDASKQDQGTGCAVFIHSADIQNLYKLNKLTSIFTAEAIGISKALEYIEQHTIKKAVILSDSLSVLQSISDPIDINNPYNNPVIQQLKLQIHRLINRNFEIILLWIKAHAGLQANEVVDRLAKESIHTGLELANDIFVKECISERKSKMKQMWNNAWKEYCTQRPTRYTFIHPTIPHELWHKDLPYSRSDIVTIARLKFGHACYPYHLNKIGVQTTNICDTCNTVSDLDHIFFGCRKYNAQSNQLHSALIKKKIQSPFNLVSLLAMNRTDIFDALLDFTKACGLKL